MQYNFVKVRGRQGTNSLDITIPVKIRNEFDIHEGDLFKVDVDDRGTIKIVYELIYKNL